MNARDELAEAVKALEVVENLLHSAWILESDAGYSADIADLHDAAVKLKKQVGTLIYT